MKKLLSLLAILISLTAFGQTAQVNNSLYTFGPAVNQRIRTSDSAMINVQLLTTGSVQGVSWSQVSGPTTLNINPVNSGYGNSFENSAFWIQPTVAGVYVIKAVGTVSVNGSTLSSPLSDTITVLPVTAPRMVSSFTLTVYGQSITIQASQLPPGVIKFADNSVQ